MIYLQKLKQYRYTLVDIQEKIESLYYDFKEKYRIRLEKYQQITDLSFLGAYLAAATMDAVYTLQNIEHHNDESHQFTSFMMESYGIDEGLLRTLGIETLQLAALLGISYIIKELWQSYKGREIGAEVRLGLVYVYLSIGISKHVQGILSWI
ncbi:MAG: hypothetical protein JSU72_14290 [Deltaproteobacteria bacterium]|nr:MAG: hypothetical protein JSU72_14290 [Deltaproteobacteria bacterium]